MTTFRGRISRRIAHWRATLETQNAILHLDDRLREDAGLPRRARDERPHFNLLNPFSYR